MQYVQKRQYNKAIFTIQRMQMIVFVCFFLLFVVKIWNNTVAFSAEKKSNAVSKARQTESIIALCPQSDLNAADLKAALKRNQSAQPASILHKQVLYLQSFRPEETDPSEHTVLFAAQAMPLPETCQKTQLPIALQDISGIALVPPVKHFSGKANFADNQKRKKNRLPTYRPIQQILLYGTSPISAPSFHPTDIQVVEFQEHKKKPSKKQRKKEPAQNLKQPATIKNKPFRPQTTDSAWVWQANDWQSETAQNRLFEKALHFDIKTLYITVPVVAARPVQQATNNITEADQKRTRNPKQENLIKHQRFSVKTPHQLAQFIRRAHKKHFNIVAVFGDPRDITATGRKKLIAKVRAICHYNQFVSVNERLDGLQFDIEPHLLPGFSVDPVFWYNQTLLTYQAIHQESTLPVDAVLPYWSIQAQLNHQTNYVYAMLPFVDRMTVMNYTTSERALSDQFLPFLKLMAQTPKTAVPVQMAVEFTALKNNRQWRFLPIENFLDQAKPFFAKGSPHQTTQKNAIQPTMLYWIPLRDRRAETSQRSNALLVLSRKALPAKSLKTLEIQTFSLVPPYEGRLMPSDRTSFRKNPQAFWQLKPTLSRLLEQSPYFSGYAYHDLSALPEKKATISQNGNWPLELLRLPGISDIFNKF